LVSHRREMFLERLKSVSVRLMLPVVLLALAGVGRGYGQTCLTASDVDDATKTALVNTTQSFFGMVTRGDSAGLRQSSIAGLAANFSGIENAVRDNQSALVGAKAVARPPFLLEADGAAPLERAEFLCGVFGPSGQTAESAVIMIPNLPPGHYGFVALDVTTAKGAYTFSTVLQQEGGGWKLGGLYIKPSQTAGHDAAWFAQRARDYKAKGQLHNAWFYYLEARDLMVPVPFMSTLATDKLYDDLQSVKPADLPGGGTPAALTADGKTFKLTDLFPSPVGEDLDVVVKYQSADVSNSAQTFRDNVAVMKALLAKYPELREAFAGVVARAVEPSGRDYGTMMAMKDVK
jgi:hypothetical protein